MKIFRSKKTDPDPAPTGSEADPASGEATAEAEPAGVELNKASPAQAGRSGTEAAGTAAAEKGDEASSTTESPAPAGPYDVGDAPDDVDRLDLGSVRIPPIPDVEIRLEVEESTGRVAAVTLTDGTSMCQVVAFAASRRSALWTEIRQEIAASVTGSGGQVSEEGGSFGTELLTQPRGGPAMRIVGVDGPRWLLRAVFNGPAAGGGEAAEALERALRSMVVVRGDAAMPPRDQLPLRLPQGVGGPTAPPEDLAERPVLTVPRRGPEITEIR